jgi:hypothetical protein
LNVNDLSHGGKVSIVFENKQTGTDRQQDQLQGAYGMRLSTLLETSGADARKATADGAGRGGSCARRASLKILRFIYH